MSGRGGQGKGLAGTHQRRYRDRDHDTTALRRCVYRTRKLPVLLRPIDIYIIWWGRAVLQSRGRTQRGSAGSRSLAITPERVDTPIFIMIIRKKALTVFGLMFIRTATSLL